MPDTEDVTFSTDGWDGPFGAEIRTAFDDAMAAQGKLTQDVGLVHGFSGQKIRLFFNNLIALMDDPRYMEIGVYCGASFISAIFQNKVTALGIDNWSWEGSRRGYFFQQLGALCSDGNSISILDTDFRQVNFSAFANYNVLFYDGSHEEKDQYDGIVLPQPSLADNYILIVDDWNWEHVRRKTFDALRDCGATVENSIEMRTTLDNTIAEWAGMGSSWHNGLFIGAVRKQAAPAA